MTKAKLNEYVAKVAAGTMTAEELAEVLANDREKGLYCKVSDNKSACSVYGIRAKFPISNHAHEWVEVFKNGKTIIDFCVENIDDLNCLPPGKHSDEAHAAARVKTLEALEELSDNYDV